MRVALVHFLSPLKNANHKGILQKLEKKKIKKGYQIDIFNAHTDSSTMRLTGYDYISIIVPSSPLFGAKLPEKFDEVLENCGMLTSKKGCALVVKSGFSSWKTCTKLMSGMEKQGILLDYFDVVENPDHASYVGKKIG